MFTLKSAHELAGGVSSRNSKMPGSSFATSPSLCNVGGKLANVQGSVCFDCYAKKSERMYPSVRIGWGNNYMRATKLIATNPDQWSKAMAFQITRHAEKNKEPYHRWFDAGDLDSVEMLKAIVKVCELTPSIKHWLPTRENAIVKAWRKAGGVEPDNLVIRASATMVNDKPIAGHSHTSTVHKGKTYTGHACPSTSKEHRALRPDNKANCGTCRACWSRDVPNVSYPLH